MPKEPETDAAEGGVAEPIEAAGAEPETEEAEPEGAGSEGAEREEAGAEGAVAEGAVAVAASRPMKILRTLRKNSGCSRLIASR